MFALCTSIKRLHRNESGQVMVFAAITMLFVVIAVIMVFQAGMLVDRRVQAQNAADAAAYSGAATKAMCVNSIEWLNDGMAYIYRKMLCYSYDSMYFSGASFTGEPEDQQNFGDAYANSAEWIERGMRWMERIGQMEEGIANATPRLIEERVRYVARRNGAHAVTLWPNYPEYETFIRRDDHLNCVFEPRGDYGWFVASNSDYMLRVTRQETDFFEFVIHDNLFAHNGVRVQDAVSFKVSRRGPRVRGNIIRFYDGRTFVVSVTIRTLDPGPPPTQEVVVKYGDGTEEHVDLNMLQDAGEISLPLDRELYPDGYPYRYATITWLLKWEGTRQAQAYLDTVSVDYGNTFVESRSDYTYLSGGFSNSSLNATYEIFNDSVGILDGGGSLFQLGSGWVYQDNYPIGQSLRPPWFVEDTVPRFLARVKKVYVPLTDIDNNDTLVNINIDSMGRKTRISTYINTAFARTRHSDDFSVRVLRDGSHMQGISQAQSWPVYGGDDDYQSVDLARIPLPLSVSEEFFRYGVNVGVWMPPESTIPFFHNPKHGFFAVASARLGKRANARGDMLTPPDDSLLTVMLPEGTQSFHEKASYSYVGTFENAAHRWSRVNTSGAQGYWQPVMTPVRETILEEDLDSTGFSYSSSAEFVFDKLINSEWYDPATGSTRPEIPRLLADIRKPQYEIMMDLELGDEYYEMRKWESPPFEYFGEEFDDAVQH